MSSLGQAGSSSAEHGRTLDGRLHGRNATSLRPRYAGRGHVRGLALPSLLTVIGVTALAFFPASANSATGAVITGFGAPAEISVSGSGAFDGVSCADVGDCTAIGDVYAIESAGTWASAISAAGSAGNLFRGLSCADTKDCTAVGQDGNGQPVYLTESDSAWGQATEIPGSAGGGGALYGVSCAGPRDCTAVGDDGNIGMPMYSTETGGAWGRLPRLPVSLSMAAISSA